MSSIPPTEREFHHLLECETSLRPDVPGSKASPQCAQNILIAVMGDTGVGKSYFIRDVSGLSTVVVGDSPGSCTSEVIEYAFEYAGITVTLIDTPGFNDTKLSDTEVLTRITSWMQKRYSDHQLLSGIIYLHRITDVRMEGPSLKNLHMFEKLVGEGCLHNVLLTTTRWSELSKERGQAREMELKLTPEYWGNMIESGATVARYIGCRESGLKLIDKLIGNMPKALTIQEELAIPGTKLIDTGTGMAINKELLEIQAKLSKDLDETKEAHKRAMEKQRDSLKRMLEGEQQKMQEQLDKIVKDREELLTRHNAREEQTASVLSTIEQKLEAERRERMEEQRRLIEHAEIRERTAGVERVKLRALMEAERKAREEAERRAREETEQRARKEAARRAKEEAERRAKEETERRAKEETERRAKEETERRAREEAARRAKEEAEKAKLMAMMEAERKRREEAGGNKLCDASRNNNEVLVRQLLENGIGVDWRNKGGDTALIIASFYSHEAIVRLLLAKGADVNMKNKYGNTALHDASFKGTEVIVRLLLEHGANIDEADGQGPALHIVLRGNRQSIVQLLLKNGANVHTRSLNNETALHSACRGGCDEAIVRFLLEKGVDVHAKCKYGMTALMFASFNGHAAIVRFLLEKGVDVNMQAINAFGTTALIEASKFGRLEVVQLLLENGADVKLKDYKGNTALSFADGYPAVVQLLRKAGAT